jgi:hypothetical protein
MTNIATDREGIDWMDGVAALDFHSYPLLRIDIPESLLSLHNLPPFYRLLTNRTANALVSWTSKSNIAREALGNYWPADFNSDGKLKRNRISWDLGRDEPVGRPMFVTNFSGGRPMRSILMHSGKQEEEEDEGTASTPADSDEPEKPKKVILLRDTKDDEKIFEMQCEIDQLRATVKLGESKYAGLRSQMNQMESAYSIRSELITNAIVTYYFAHTNIRMLAPSIATLVDETISPDDIALAAGGIATLDHRVRVVAEIANRLSIPITIDREIVGMDDSTE